jgi:hypothetical protein
MLVGADVDCGLRSIVASALQPRPHAPATNPAQGDEQPSEDHMLTYAAARRLLGFDMGDWALLLGGFALVGMVTLLTA